MNPGLLYNSVFISYGMKGQLSKNCVAKACGVYGQVSA